MMNNTSSSSCVHVCVYVFSDYRKSISSIRSFSLSLLCSEELSFHLHRSGLRTYFSHLYHSSLKVSCFFSLHHYILKDSHSLVIYYICFLSYHTSALYFEGFTFTEDIFVSSVTCSYILLKFTILLIRIHWIFVG